jgi:hypothetical protein
MKDVAGSVSCVGGKTEQKSSQDTEDFDCDSAGDSKLDERRMDGFHGVLNLTPAESKWLMDLLNSPPKEPTPTMIRASQRRRELLGE